MRRMSPVLPRRPGLPGPSLAEAAGARAGEFGRARLDPPATVSRTTAAHPAATGTIVTPSLGGASSFWLQPADPGLHHAGETVRPPPVTTTASGTAPAPVAALLTPSWRDDNFAVEPALIANRLPTGFDASRLIVDAGLFDEFGPAAGRAGADAGTPPPAADPWRIRPPGMSAEPHPVAFDPWSAPPGPGSRVMHAETIRTPVLSAGAPPGWQGAVTHSFVRAASGAVELPFSRREAIARLDANLTLRTGGAGAFGWSAARWRAVLDDLYRINTIARSITPATAHIDWSSMTADIDWSAIETLMRTLHASPPSP